MAHATHVVADLRCVAAELSSARRILGRPSRSPRPDSHRGPLVQGQVGLLLPHGAMVAPPRFEQDPLAQDEVRFRLRHGAVTAAYERTRAGERQGMASPTGRIPKPNGTPEPVSAYGGGTTFE